MAVRTHELSGLEKASVLMMSLGASASAKVFEQLTPTERELLGAKIASLRRVDDVTRQVVLSEVSEFVRTGYIPKATNILAEEKPEQSGPLVWLEKMDMSDVARILSTERPQNVALIMSYLSPHTAADILSRLDENARNQTALRLATMRPPSQEVVAAVDAALKKRFSDAARGIFPGSRNKDTLLKILNGATERVRESVHGNHTAPELKVAAQISSLEDLISLSDVEVCFVLEKVDCADLCAALRIASEDLKDKVFRNISEELAAMVRHELDSPMQIRLGEIERSQERIVTTVRKMRNEDAVGSWRASIE